jgi:hypothetical protein
MIPVYRLYNKGINKKVGNGTRTGGATHTDE